MPKQRGRTSGRQSKSSPGRNIRPSASLSSAVTASPAHPLTSSVFPWLARGGILLILLIAGWAAGSAMRSRHGQEWPPRDKRIRVLTTIFPIYDFARQVGGEDVAVRNLLPPGVDPHEFALSPRDISLVAGADVILSNGAGLDDFIAEAIAKSGISSANVVSLTDGMNVISARNEAGGETSDPHLWLDPDRAEAYVGRISVTIADEQQKRGDMEAQERVRSRAIALGRSLVELDRDYEKETARLKGRSFIAFHGAFGYLAQRYGLGLAGVWQRTPGREPSPREVEVLLKIARSANVKALFAEPQFSPRALEMIAADAHLPVYTLDPLETAEDFEHTHYMDVMRHNLKVLTTALGRDK